MSASSAAIKIQALRAVNTRPRSSDHVFMDLCAAIHGRRLVEFVYGGHRRVVAPVIHGEHVLSRNHLLRGWQTAGGSASGAVPGWRMFSVAEMSDLRVLAAGFVEFTVKEQPWPRGTGQVHVTSRRGLLGTVLGLPEVLDASAQRMLKAAARDPFTWGSSRGARTRLYSTDREDD